MTPRIGVRGLKSSPLCKECPCARLGASVKPVPAFGGTDGLCIVGEGPGNTEIQQGFPFIGPSGKVVDLGFKHAGIERGRVFIVNSLLCARPHSDEAFARAIECCRPRLQKDLEVAAPKAICALGGTALRALQLPVTGVADARGTIQYSPLLQGVPVVGSIHPAAILRGGAGELAGAGGKQKMNADAQALFIFSDIEKANAIATGRVDPRWSDDVLVVHDPAEVEAELQAILVDIYEWGCLGLDLEWVCRDSKNALDALGAGAHRAQITWVGVGCEKRAVSFKWEALVESGQLEVLQAAIADPDLCKLSHNKQADQAVWEAQVGPAAGRWFDSMLAHHAACPGIDHDLQNVVSQFLCVPAWKVMHAAAIKEHEVAQKELAKQEKQRAKDEKKVARKAEHDRKNAEKAADKAARQAQKQKEHEERNVKAAADKVARKAANRAKHEARNEAARKPRGPKVAPVADPRVVDDEGGTTCYVDEVTGEKLAF
jgi:uracil-DNA glycosylase family 4